MGEIERDTPVSSMGYKLSFGNTGDDVSTNRKKSDERTCMSNVFPPAYQTPPVIANIRWGGRTKVWAFYVARTYVSASVF